MVQLLSCPKNLANFRVLYAAIAFFTFIFLLILLNTSHNNQFRRLAKTVYQNYNTIKHVTGPGDRTFVPAKNDTIRTEAEQGVNAEVSPTKMVQYLGLTNDGRCKNCNCRLGNKMFTYAAIYGMARALDRAPAVDLLAPGNCTINELKSLQATFPNMISMFPLVNFTDEQKAVGHGAGFCTYTNVKRLRNHDKVQNLLIHREFWQNYRYFNDFRDEIVQLFTINSSHAGKASQLADEFSAKGQIDAVSSTDDKTMQTSKRHFLCVHIRRDDYIRVNKRRHNWYQASGENFTISAVKYLLKNVSDFDNWATVLMGDDPEWAKALFTVDAEATMLGQDKTADDKDSVNLTGQPNNSRIHLPFQYGRNVFVPEANSTSPSVDMAFFHNHCQIVLLTAPQSTFGFWAAYLSKADAIYYNGNADSHGANQKAFSCNYWPKQWKPLARGEVKEII